jgi:ubiquinone/menaquinone biosynthesis C-methylase UbiE
MKTDFEREIEWWKPKSSSEETDLDDARINRMLRWREIERHLDGVVTIAEIGGATGAFSIPLAERGFKVTHVDFSETALGVAREKAKGISNIHFLEAKAVDLSMFVDGAFDLVLIAKPKQLSRKAAESAERR